MESYSSEKPFNARVLDILSTSYNDEKIGKALSIIESQHGIVKPQEQDKPSPTGIESDSIESLLQVNGKLIDCHEPLIEKLKGVGGLLERTRRIYDEADRKNADIKRSLQPLLMETSRLREEQAKSVQQKQLYDAFYSKFMISESEVLKLTTASGDLDPEFFSNFQRVSGIYKDCRLLLPSSTQTAGLAIMEQMTKYMDSAYQNLYRWTQRCVKMATMPDTTEMNLAQLQEAFSLLCDRQGLFRKCLESLSERRQNSHLESFLESLSRGNSEYLTPIDMNASDPFRYAGDMLAWIHQRIASEKEYLENVLSRVSLQDGDEKMQMPFEATVIAKNRVHLISFLLDHNLRLLSRPLRSRIEASIAKTTDLKLLFKLRNLITFYSEMLLKELNSNAGLLRTLRSVIDFISSQIAMAQKSMSPNAAEVESDDALKALQPPEFLLGVLKLLRELIEMNRKSFTQTSSGLADLNAVVFGLLDPAIECCEEVSSKFPGPDNSIFVLNCVCQIQSELSGFDEAKEKLDLLSVFEDRLCESIQNAQLDFFLTGSHLKIALNAMESNELEARHVEDVAQTSETFIASAATDAQDRLQSLNRSRLASKLTNNAARSFVKSYKQLEGFVVKNFEFPRTMLPRSALDLQVILGVEGDNVL